ncbi:MAG TPA: hypothetical protein VEU62_01005 [Bryobacterales bacterium]|nr:hypothetical protein [Bryobacterales bacterium]
MRNRWTYIVVAGVLGLGLTAGAAFGQSKDDHLTVRQRQENQQDRIVQGVKSGTLSPRETANLENKEAKLNHEIRDDREDHGGKLTPKEHRQVNRQQNRLSRQIYRKKHDGPGK